MELNIYFRNYERKTLYESHCLWVSHFPTYSYKEAVIACDIRIYQFNDFATKPQHTHTHIQCVWWKFVCALCEHAGKLYWLPALDWLIDLYDKSEEEEEGGTERISEKIALFFCFCFHFHFVLLYVYCNCLRRSRMCVSHWHIHKSPWMLIERGGGYWPMAMPFSGMRH